MFHNISSPCLHIPPIMHFRFFYLEHNNSIAYLFSAIFVSLVRKGMEDCGKVMLAPGPVTKTFTLVYGQQFQKLASL